jgi:succinate-semialdehyde dehydrogenase / glutarate-semialdehyde dehydrogenase
MKLEKTGADFWATHTVPSRLDKSRIERLSAIVTSESDSRIGIPVPFTGELIGTIPACTPADIAAAVRRARAEQPGWAQRRFADRAAALLRFHDSLLSRQEEALDLIQLESGKARRYALEEIQDTALVARHYALNAERYLKPRRHAGALPLLTTAWEYRHPAGVVGFIAPWNFPLILSITDLLAALMAGNTAVLRPDVQSSFTALWAADLLYQCGVPAGVLRVVTGPGRILGPALIDAVDFIMFTGSTRTGKVVARQASERLIGCSLELGGKNSLIVLDDANLDRAVDGLVRGAFVGAGQVCVSIERAHVPERRFDEFCDKLKARIGQMKLSPELAYGVDMGSLTLPSQLEAVQGHVRDAVTKGARVLAGGRGRPDLGPLFYEPTVLAGVTPAMRVYAEETFGPLVSLYPYRSEDEAVERINDTPYGLNASVWSRSTRRALGIAKRIRAGSVNINESYAATWTATASPIGGMGESGSGRRHGAEGILKYTEAQTIAVNHGPPLGPPSWVTESSYAKQTGRLLKWVRHVPGLR